MQKNGTSFSIVPHTSSLVHEIAGIEGGWVTRGAEGEGGDAGKNSDGGRREGLVLGKGVGDEVGANCSQEEGGQEEEGQEHVSEAREDSRDAGEEEKRSEQEDSLHGGWEEKGSEWHEGHDEASAAREDMVGVEREDVSWGKPEC